MASTISYQAPVHPKARLDLRRQSEKKPWKQNTALAIMNVLSLRREGIYLKSYNSIGNVRDRHLPAAPATITAPGLVSCCSTRPYASQYSLLHSSDSMSIGIKMGSQDTGGTARTQGTARTLHYRPQALLPP